MGEKSIMEQQMKLLQTVVEQQQSYIQAQNALVAEKDARMAEKDETIVELRKLVDDLQSLKANLEETLRELRRQLFGTASEKIPPSENADPLNDAPAIVKVKEHTRERNPNEEDGVYQQAISALYSIAYILKMSYKTEHKI